MADAAGRIFAVEECHTLAYVYALHTCGAASSGVTSLSLSLPIFLYNIVEDFRLSLSLSATRRRTLSILHPSLSGVNAFSLYTYIYTHTQTRVVHA